MTSESIPPASHCVRVYEYKCKSQFRLWTGCGLERDKHKVLFPDLRNKRIYLTHSWGAVGRP